MKPLHKLTVVLSGTLLFLAEGCTHKDLRDDAPTTIAESVDVVFDWSKVTEPKATAMILYLYSDDREVMNFWFKNRDGGIIKSYAGRHTAICHSNDDPYAFNLRGHDTHAGFEIFTESTSVLIGQGISARGIPRADGTEDEPLRATPPLIYGTSDTDINLKASAHTQTLKLYPEELVCHYSVEFADVENLKSAETRIDATISSLAGGVYPGAMTTTSEVVSHTFTLAPDDELNSLHAEFFTFGIPAGEALPHKICVYIALRNRTGNFYTFDVSNQINFAPDPRNVRIKINGLKLPELPDDPTPPPSEGGVSVDINSWETIYYDIPV